MNTYDLIFETEALTSTAEDAIYDSLDAIVTNHGRSTLVMVTADGPTACSAAFSACRALEGAGATVLRLCEDLVSRAMIASRAEVTPQAVGQWIRGERQGDRGFPRPFTQAGSELYLWGEVNDWLAGVGKADGLQHPSHADYADVNAALLRRRSQATSHAKSGWRSEGFATVGATSVSAAKAPVPVRPRLTVAPPNAA